jgi:quercetin dioxygenase-like cupin family protein
MALSHATPGQIVDILGSTVPSAQTLALFKSSELEVMRLILPAGKAVPSHRVAGEITVQCLEGSFEIMVEGRTQVMHAGQLLHLSGGTQHGFVALEDASALVTIVLHK